MTPNCPFCGSAEHFVYDVKLCVAFWKGDAKAAQRETKKAQKELKDLEASIEAERWRIDEL